MADVNIQFVNGDEIDGPYVVTQTDEWNRFIKSVDTLPSTMKSLKKLINDGSVSDTEEVSIELDAILAANMISDFEGLVTELRKLIGEGDSQETAEIVGDE